MRKAILAALFVILILLAKTESYSQISLPKEKSCQPTAEEILSIIKSVYNWDPIPEGVFIAGETTVGGIKNLPPKSFSLLQFLSMRGGVQRTAKQPIYLIRQSSEDQTRINLEVDIREIKQGRAKDVMLENGDIIFVSKGCVGGKLLLPKKPGLQIVNPPGTPTVIRDERDAR